MTPSRRALLASGLLFPLISLLGGCGGGGDAAGPAAPMHPVKGKIVYKDAAALKDIKLRFIPRGAGAQMATADLKPDGSFEIKTGDKDGICEGEYGVRLERTVTVKGKVPPSPISSQYFDEDGASLSASIKADTSELPPFDLKPLAKAAAGGRKAARDND